jgi:hypothetical protein
MYTKNTSTTNLRRIFSSRERGCPWLRFITVPQPILNDPVHFLGQHGRHGQQMPENLCFLRDFAVALRLSFGQQVEDA